MHKHLKSITAAIMAVAMLISISTSAMAAEQTFSEREDILLQSSEKKIGQAYGYANYSGSMVEVTSIRIDGKASLLKHRITGPANQWVNVRLVHSSGDFRVFTGVSNGEWLSDRYVTDMPEGYWKIYIIGAGASGKYKIWVNAYSTN